MEQNIKEKKKKRPMRIKAFSNSFHVIFFPKDKPRSLKFLYSQIQKIFKEFAIPKNPPPAKKKKRKKKKRKTVDTTTFCVGSLDTELQKS